MLSILPLVVALATVPSPAPSSRPTPLQEIGRVRALPACTPIVVHANGAITQALDNDRGLAILTNNLRAVDYDKLNSLQRRNAINALEKQASEIRINAGNADGEIKRLREYAAASNDPQRKAELKAFADALGGALVRQKRAANELMRDITIIQGRIDAAEARAILTRDSLTPENGMPVLPRAALPAPPNSWNETMRAIASALDDRTEAIVADEGVAADHSIAATSGC
ncbi:MAG: hypothetical protein QOI11_2834 [Candidatus Eremiobacteraeota bacterium]|jgi:hypothetical protein|nr:hypothetical protein [Candidatus Eremiobacteraeota bacterium]